LLIHHYWLWIPVPWFLTVIVRNKSWIYKNVTVTCALLMTLAAQTLVLLCSSHKILSSDNKHSQHRSYHKQDKTYLIRTGKKKMKLTSSQLHSSTLSLWSRYPQTTFPGCSSPSTELVTKFPALYVNQSSNTIFTKTHYFSLF